MTTPLSKEQVRAARLRALGHDDSTLTTQDFDSWSINQPAEKKQTLIGYSRRFLDEQEFQEMENVMFGGRKRLFQRGGLATDQDLHRWYEQGFQFCGNLESFLRQGNGGPCGILAVVQAEILREMLFSTNKDNMNIQSGDLLPNQISKSQAEYLLTNAISVILNRAAMMEGDNEKSIYLVSPANETNLINFESLQSNYLAVVKYSNIEDARQGVIDRLPYFQSQQGCVLFLMSLILSRGIRQCQQDMDDPSNTLIGQFGHCNQDLLNLLLTGKATSNVMDGDVPLGDSGLVIKGVSNYTQIGYLTHLEALRYCQVGSYLKTPENPIWVIGSSSHFTVLFSRNRKLNEGSDSDKMISTLQRCFKAVDTDECGFIHVDKLANVLELIAKDSSRLDQTGLIASILSNPIDLARLRGHLQIDGEIIIWSTFWEEMSKMLSQSLSLDSLITSNSVAIIEDSDKFNSPPTVVDNRPRSDSEIAKELQRQLDMDDDQPPPLLEPASAPTFFNTNTNTKMDVNNNIGDSNRQRSDSEIARELQAAWDSEAYMPESNNGWNYNNNNNSNNNFTSSTPFSNNNSNNISCGESHSVTSLNESFNTKLPPISSPPPANQHEVIFKRSHLHRSDSIAGEDSDSYVAYHFNGMENNTRSAKLTQFKIFLRSPDNVVGQSVGFSGNNGSGSYNCPIEEILRTRWPGCRIDWLNQPTPSID